MGIKFTDSIQSDSFQKASLLNNVEGVRVNNYSFLFISKKNKKKTLALLYWSFTFFSSKRTLWI